MTQGFARLAETIDPLDDRLDGTADHQWDDVLDDVVAIAVGDWANREKPAIRARFQIRSVTPMVVSRPAEKPKRYEALQGAEAAQRRQLPDGPADALDDDIQTLAGRYLANALSEAFCG